MKLQEYINISSALIVLVGGLAIVFLYPGKMEGHFRVIIGLFVTVYFLIRVTQAVSLLRRKRGEKQGFKHLLENGEDDEG